jgi:hypothetical protein
VITVLDCCSAAAVLSVASTTAHHHASTLFIHHASTLSTMHLLYSSRTNAAIMTTYECSDHDAMSQLSLQHQRYYTHQPHHGAGKR